MKDRSDDPSHHERTLLPRCMIMIMMMIMMNMMMMMMMVMSHVALIPECVYR